jgi:hypothetical protein
VIKQRGLYQCNGCRAQTSVISGTIFASTKLELKVWFRAMYLMTQSKQGISWLELSRRLGVCYDPAWKIHHKLAQAMMERDTVKPLEGRVETDDVYLGGERSGGKRGRGSPGKMPIVAAVETTGDGKPVRLKIRCRAANAQPVHRAHSGALSRGRRQTAQEKPRQKVKRGFRYGCS